MRRIWLLLLASVIPEMVRAKADTVLWDLSLAELSSIQVTRLATGSPTPLNRAAAITTIITAKEIRNIGARDIDDVLMSIPGLYVGRSDQTYTPMYVIRGVYGRFNPQTLFMINGIPYKNLPVGNRSLAWGGMPVEAIERIEVIRGPGSALYGADAFAGVINVITKTNVEIEGTAVGARAGSFDTYSGWVQNSGMLSDWGYAISVEAGTTRGHDDTILVDLQTQLDELQGTNVSRAPGPINTGYDWLDLFFDASKDEWRFRVGYQRRSNLENGAGVAGALDPSSKYKSDRLSTDVTFTQDDWLEDWSLVTQLNVFYDNQRKQHYHTLLPAGAYEGVFTGGAPGVPNVPEGFPDGAIGYPEYEEIQVGFQQYGVYTGFIDHRLRLAIGAHWGDVYRTEESQNFAISPQFGIVPRAEGLVDVSDTEDVWLPEEDRKVYFVSVQDEWQISANWQLVSGVRYDHYSDFGETLNPRMALVWLTTQQLTTRLLYGRAFRAPSFTELYVKSNPVITGNADLNPETINTYELGFNYEVDGGHYYNLNYFYYVINGMIQYESTGNGQSKLATNGGDRHGRGVEIEAFYSFGEGITWVANYSFQESIDDESREDVGGAPNHQAYTRLNWPLNSFWNLSTELHWFGEVEREPTDAREPLDSAAILNISIVRSRIYENMDLALTVRNLTDKDWSTPSPDLQPVSTPYDYPSPGINGDISIRYQF